MLTATRVHGHGHVPSDSHAKIKRKPVRTHIFWWWWVVQAVAKGILFLLAVHTTLAIPKPMSASAPRSLQGGGQRRPVVAGRVVWRHLHAGSVNRHYWFEGKMNFCDVARPG